MLEKVWGRNSQVFGTRDSCRAACSLHGLPRDRFILSEGTPHTPITVNESQMIVGATLL